MCVFRLFIASTITVIAFLNIFIKGEEKESVYVKRGREREKKNKRDFYVIIEILNERRSFNIIIPMMYGNTSVFVIE